jgi:hypothetical protein
MTADSISRVDMDRLVDAHFRAEMEVRIPEILAGFTDEIEHDIVGRPAVLHGKKATGEMYTDLLRGLSIQEFLPVRRLYGDDFLVDESIVEGKAIGQFLGIEGRGRPVRFRLLHIFEFRDGLIDRENAWLDVAAVQRQLASG